MERERLDIIIIPSLREQLPPSEQPYHTHNFEPTNQPMSHLRGPPPPPLGHYKRQSLWTQAPPWNQSIPADSQDLCPDDNITGFFMGLHRSYLP